MFGGRLEVNLGDRLSDFESSAARVTLYSVGLNTRLRIVKRMPFPLKGARLTGIACCSACPAFFKGIQRGIQNKFTKARF